MNINNYLENKKQEYGVDNVNGFIDLYDNIENSRLKIIFSKMHFEINSLFKYLNQRLGTSHYTAFESRKLIKWIDEIYEIQSNLKRTDLEFSVDSYYQDIFEKCSEFLCESGGSPIPAEFKKINLILIEPIFIIHNMTKVISSKTTTLYPTTLIGKGSYGQVFKYKDDYYNKYFVIKRANSDLTEKEYKRFKLEYEEMKKLNSPYIVEVYRFDDDKHEYIMEYIDYTLYKYITTNNNKLTKVERKNIALQILKAFEYIHSKEILHRDISLTNILVKKYDNLNVIKISDFGLVKIQDSNLTSLDTEVKGSLNDPYLKVYGFKNYNIAHETYALTRIIYFVMTGRIQVEKFDNEAMKEFVLRGLNKDLEKRYQSISDIRIAFGKL